jgi:hypothetical protein
MMSMSHPEVHLLADATFAIGTEKPHDEAGTSIWPFTSGFTLNWTFHEQLALASVASDARPKKLARCARLKRANKLQQCFLITELLRESIGQRSPGARMRQGKPIN